MSHMLRPYTEAEVRANLDKDGYISGNIEVGLSEIINRDLEGFLDMISMKLVNSDLLMNVNYEVVGASRGGSLVVRVMGNPSGILGDEPEEIVEKCHPNEQKKLVTHSILVKRTINVRIDNIKTVTQTAAIAALEGTPWKEIFPTRDKPSFDLNTQHNPDGSLPTIRYIEDSGDTSEYLVDEEGDGENVRSRWYETDGITLI